MDAIHSVAEVECPGPQRIAWAASHKARQVWLARDHFGRGIPVGPLGLARDAQQSGPLEAITTHPDAVTQRSVVALDHVEETFGRLDNNGSGSLGRAVEHNLPSKGSRKLLCFRVRNVAGLFVDLHRLWR